MRCPSGPALSLAGAVLLICANGAWAQGETQAVSPPPTRPLNTLPHWSEFPVAPTDVPKAAEIKQRVENQMALKQALNAQFNSLTWDVYAPDALATAARSQVDPAKMGPVEVPLTTSQMESLWTALRAKAAPPPVAD
jgi:hypothetical protein